MATITVDQYEDLLRRSGLVEKDQLDKALATIVSEFGGRPSESGVLAKRLIDARLITRWQNEKLMEGRHRGFFLGKYKLLAHVSRGGMSEVYMAEQVMMRRRVAIKVFPPDLIEQASYLERFYQESRTQASMDHPNIVRAHDFGNEGKIHYLVMEYVDGPDLEQLVNQKGPLPYDKAVAFIQQAAEALSYAHSRNMIHRDIKPANLMLDRSGLIKLLDLGLARLTEGDQASLTLKHNENTLGTADYLAPEQAVDSHNVDARADIYSLGCTLYFLLTGHPPFPEGTPVQRLMMHMNQEPAPISADRADVPEDLVDICKKMMAKKPEQRYQTAAEVREAMGQWLEGHGFKSAVAEPVVPPEEAAASGIGHLESAPQPAPKAKPTAKPQQPAPERTVQTATRQRPAAPPQRKPPQKPPQRKPAPRAAPEREAEPAPAPEEPLIKTDTVSAADAARARAGRAGGASERPAPAAASPAFEIGYGALLGATAGLVVGLVTQGTSGDLVTNLFTWLVAGALPGAVAGAFRLVIGKG